MFRQVLRRLSTLPIVLVGVAIALFVSSQVLPTDVVRLIAGDSVTPELRAAIEARLGLDQPIWVQFWNYMGRLLRGDLGTSIRFQLPVSQLVADALPASLTLFGAAAVVAVLIAFPVGVLAARFRGSWFDVLSRGLVVVGISSPPFFLGLLAILWFGLYLGWFPVSGRGDPPDLYHLVLPALVLGFREAGSTTRVLRASILDELSSEQARAARARGMTRRYVLMKNGVRNGLIPAVTDFGTTMTELAGALILIEIVFGWPGIGNLLYIGVRWNDFPLVSGTVLFLVLYAVAANLIVDLLYGVIDPRLRG